MLPQILFSESFIFYTYPFIMGLAWAIGYQLSICFLKTAQINFNHFRFFFWGNFLISWVGAKALFLFTQNVLPSNELGANLSFWLGGGFVFYGGLAACLIYSMVFIKVTKQSWQNLTPMIPAIPLAHAIGRIGCLLAGCCYGSMTSFPLSVYMHQAHRHPVQLYEALYLLLLGTYLIRHRKISHYLLGYSVFRFGIEFLRGDAIRGQVYCLSTSQWVAVLMVIVSLGVMRNRSFKLTKV